jgi:hypothetical protein
MADATRGSVDYSRAFFGGLLMLWGGLLLADRMGLADMQPIWPYWPLWLVLWGTVKLMLPGRGRGSGAWLVLVGILLLGSTLHVVSFRQTWPVFVVAAGGSMVWRSLRSQREVNDGR